MISPQVYDYYVSFVSPGIWTTGWQRRQQWPSIPTQSPPVHSQDWLGIPVLPRSWPMISKCSFQDLRILRNTVYRNSDSVEIGAQNTLPNQKTAGHSIKLTWWQNPDLHSHTIDCNEDIAAITLADKSLHIIYMYVNGTEWKSSQVKEMLKKPCKPA